MHQLDPKLILVVHKHKGSTLEERKQKGSEEYIPLMRPSQR